MAPVETGAPIVIEFSADTGRQVRVGMEFIGHTFAGQILRD